MSNASNDSDGPIIVFDAMCVLCSANAAFVLRHDRAGRFRLASMQGDIGAALYRQFGIDPANPETLIVVENGQALRDSDAVLAIWAGLDRPWNGALAARHDSRAARALPSPSPIPDTCDSWEEVVREAVRAGAVSLADSLL